MESEEAVQFLRKYPKCQEVVVPYLTGEDLVENYAPSRWIVDFGKRPLFEAMHFAPAFERIKQTVLPNVQRKADAEKMSSGHENGPRAQHLKVWWQFWRPRPELIRRLASIPRYIACSRVTKRPIFEFVDSQIHPNDATVAFTFADDYSFGILQSPMHFEWFKARCSTMKADFRYTSDTVFDSFSWPQSPTKRQVVDVAAAAVNLRKLRREIMNKLGCSLRDLYRTLDMPGANPLRDAHTALNTAVRAAYGMPESVDPLTFLLALNLELAVKEKANELVTPPGLPLPKNERSAFMTTDCITI